MQLPSGDGVPEMMREWGGEVKRKSDWMHCRLNHTIEHSSALKGNKYILVNFTQKKVSHKDRKNGGKM